MCVNEVYDGCVIVCVQTCVLMKSVMGVLLLCTDLCVNEVYDGCVIVCVQIVLCVNEVYDGCVIVCVQICVLMKSMMGVLLFVYRFVC